MPVEVTPDVEQSSRHEQIVGIEPAHDLTVDHREGLIDRIGLTAVVLGFPLEPIFLGQRLDHLDGGVGRRAVADRVMQPRVGLIHHAADRPLDEVRLIEGRRHDRDRGVTSRRFGQVERFRNDGLGRVLPQIAHAPRELVQAILARPIEARVRPLVRAPHQSQRRRRAGFRLTRRPGHEGFSLSAAACSSNFFFRRLAAPRSLVPVSMPRSHSRG